MFEKFSGMKKTENFLMFQRIVNYETMITKLEEIIQTVQGQPRKKLVVAYAQDSHTLEAVGAAVDMGIV